MGPGTKAVVNYFLLPGIVPRVREIITSGFSTVALMMACAFRAARLLPDAHPYFQPANYGRFGIRHVVAEAGRRVRYTRDHIDQVIVFYAILLAVFLLAGQFALAFMALFIPAAHAMSAGYLNVFFRPVAPRDDIAFSMLDQVFGLPGFFNSKYATDAAFAPFPTPFHQGLHQMFYYYNLGLMMVAFIIILYFVIAVVGETAKTGMPFGQRFNKLMAPLRLILAFALLTPVPYGNMANPVFNWAQLITLQSAKWGSNLATNAWLQLNAQLRATAVTPIGPANTLIATPNAPDINNLAEFIFVARVCREAYALLYPGTDIQPFVVYPNKAPIRLGQAGAANLTQLLAFSENNPITIRFGEENVLNYRDETGFIKPLCGELTYTIQDVQQDGPRYLQEGMIASDTWVFGGLVRALWGDAVNIIPAAENMARARLSSLPNRDPTLPQPTAATVQAIMAYFNRLMMTDAAEPLVPTAVQRQVAYATYNQNFDRYGWAGGGIWYNTLAQMNGSMISATFNLPTPRRYPQVMEEVLEFKKQNDGDITGPTRYRPILGKGQKQGQEVPLSSRLDYELANLFFEAQKLWADQYTPSSSNFLIDAMRMLFGLDGLISMRDNVNVHPLVQLVSIGRGLIEHSVSSFGYAIGGKVLGGLGNLLSSNVITTVGSAASGFAVQIGVIGLSVGFLLYYVLPFLPFIYFFIAATNWVKSIFEAMVGAPLWAIAHIRIDGEGIPGPAGMNGYYLLFEIFIRPILIVFGLMAAVIIYTTQVRVLHDIWPEVVSNVSGYKIPAAGSPAANPADTALGGIRYIRAQADMFFFMIIYAIIVYLLGLASFKLIDLIPTRILRWIGSNVKTFNEGAQGLPETVMSQMFTGSQTVMTQSVDMASTQILLRNS